MGVETNEKLSANEEMLFKERSKIIADFVLGRHEEHRTETYANSAIEGRLLAARSKLILEIVLDQQADKG